MPIIIALDTNRLSPSPTHHIYLQPLPQIAGCITRTKAIGLLTGQNVHIFLTAQFIPPTHFPHELIASREYSNTEKGYDEGEGGADVPPVEDDAEVRGVPGEEHLAEHR